MAGELRVVATAGHVDHGKSSLIIRLTGMDPDRFDEEKRRGMTIDLGYAWLSLPSGTEVGFVDVPGHERFIANMLAGVGPVRLVLFVVAADEGWKPQSEEHLQILDVLDVAGGVVAVTKRDLVDGDALELVLEDVRQRLRGTGLERAALVPVSAKTGEGIAELTEALDAVLAAAPPPQESRVRQHIDRVFTIKGAGTIVTGTLEGSCIAVGDEVELYPSGRRARVRGLQTHKKPEPEACPVHRVAANLVGIERDELRRGDVLGSPRAWRVTTTFEAELRAVRGLDRAVGARGAFKLYAGAAEVDARIRFLGSTGLPPDGRAFAHLRVSRPLVLDVFDRFVVREAGRRTTVAGGRVLDVRPPRKAGDAVARLEARASATRDELPELLATERGAVRADEAFVLTGSGAHGAAAVVGDFLVDPAVRAAAERVMSEALATYHRDHPLHEGMPLADARVTIMTAISSEDRDLVGAILDDLPLVRTASVVRSSDHRVVLEERADDVDALVAAASGTAPPSMAELISAGHPRELIDAAARSGEVVRVGSDLVFAAGTIDEMRVWARERTAGFTVSEFRAAFSTSRKFALPVLEWFDEHGITRRQGDLRFPRG